MARFDTEADKLAMIDATLGYVEGEISLLEERVGNLGTLASMTCLQSRLAEGIPLCKLHASGTYIEDDSVDEL